MPRRRSPSDPDPDADPAQRPAGVLRFTRTRPVVRPTVSPDETEAALGRRLVAGHQAGNDPEQAVVADRLVELTYRRIFGALVKLCDGDADRAADLTQETYRKAWQSLSSFRADCAFSTWLYRIAFNTYLNSKRRPQAVALDALDPERLAGSGAGTGGADDRRGSIVPALVDPGPAADEDLARREEESALRRAVAQLPEPLRFAVTARYWGGLSSPEIAALERISAVAVRKRLMKALHQLTQLLGATPPMPVPEAALLTVPPAEGRVDVKTTGQDDANANADANTNTEEDLR